MTPLDEIENFNNLTPQKRAQYELKFHKKYSHKKVIRVEDIGNLTAKIILDDNTEIKVSGLIAKQILRGI